MSVFRWPARVYWEDTDGGAIVYYANYLRFLERSRTEWLRACGHSQAELAREPGILFTVVSVQVDYRAPARLDDELEITCEPRAQGRRRCVLRSASIAPRRASAPTAPCWWRRTCASRAWMRAASGPGACRSSCSRRCTRRRRVVGEPLSIVKLIVQASVPVQIVIGLLLLASLSSWAIIFRKRRIIGRARREADRFESRFWSGDDLAQLYRAIEARGGATGMAGIFEFGFREFARLRQSAAAADQLLEGSRRAMRVAQLKEIDRLEHSLATLATVGSTSPYVGLFGTVWGIMSAFSSLGNVQQATLAMVAPGISEALVATAFGLFAAIPAVVAYNRFADQVTRLEMRFDAFIEEFSTILQRHAARGSAMPTGQER